MEQVVVTYFKGLFTTGHPQEIDLVTEVILVCVDDGMKQHLDKVFTQAEVFEELN